MDIDRPQDTILELVVDVVTAYVSNNSVPVGDVPDLIRSIYSTFSGLKSAPEPAAETLKPAVPVKKSVTADYIICLEDGKKFKSLRRHLATSFGLTPEAYREKWSLPPDYPMTAPNYSQVRSSLAKTVGLGRRKDGVSLATKAGLGRKKDTAPKSKSSKAKAEPDASGSKARSAA